MPRAIHSAREKCPGMTGRTFIKKSSNETTIPRPVTMRMELRFSTSQNDTQAASQPSADAIDPTSVTGTRSASPSRTPANVPTVIPRTAADGVRNFSCTSPKRGGIVPRRNISHRCYCEDIKTCTNKKRHGDRAKESRRGKFKMGFLRRLGRRFESGHEIGYDFKCQND